MRDLKAKSSQRASTLFNQHLTILRRLPVELLELGTSRPVNISQLLWDNDTPDPFRTAALSWLPQLALQNLIEPGCGHTCPWGNVLIDSETVQHEVGIIPVGNLVPGHSASRHTTSCQHRAHERPRQPEVMKDNSSACQWNQSHGGRAQKKNIPCSCGTLTPPTLLPAQLKLYFMQTVLCVLPTNRWLY